MLFGQSCKLSQEKGQKTWELELIDGRSLTCFLFKKNSFPLVFPFLNTSGKMGRTSYSTPRQEMAFFGLK